MNKTLAMIALGFISSIVLAFAILYIINMTTPPKTAPQLTTTLMNQNASATQSKPHYIILFENASVLSAYALSLNSFSNTSLSPESLEEVYNYYIREVNGIIRNSTIITTYPSIIIAKPGSQTWFLLIIVTNSTNDKIWISNTNPPLFNIIGRQLLEMNGNIYYYNVTLTISSSAEQNTLIMIPIWDSNYGYVTYIQIYVI